MITETQPVAAAAAPAPTRLLNRNYLLVWQGQAISRMGDQVFAVALAFWVKDITGSATLLGLVVALSALPGLVLDPIGGAVADRYPRKRIIIASDVLSGLLVLSLAAAIAVAPHAPATLVWLFGVALLLGVINSFFIPAIAASIPDIVPHDRLTGANAMGQLSAQVAMFFGQGLGGVLYRLVGAPLLLLFNGLSFLFAASSTSLARIPQPPSARFSDWRALLAAFAGDLREGLRFVCRQPGLREFIVISTAISFFNAPILVLLPFYVEDTLGMPSDWYGYIAAAYGVGALLGYLLVLPLRLSGQARGVSIVLCFLLGPIGTVALGQAASPWLAVALALLGGVTSGFVGVHVTTLLQMQTPSAMRGRVFGLLGALGGAVAPVAAGFSGVVADLLQQDIRLIYSGCGVIMLAIAIAGALNPGFRRFVSAAPESMAGESRRHD